MTNEFNQLKECPFCGGRAYKMYIVDNNHFVVNIKCDNCDTSKCGRERFNNPSVNPLSLYIRIAEKKAIDAWNKRA